MPETSPLRLSLPSLTLLLQAGWKENHAAFVLELKNLRATSLSTFGCALKESFDLLNIHRLHTSIDHYGQVSGLGKDSCLSNCERLFLCLHFSAPLLPSVPSFLSFLLLSSSSLLSLHFLLSPLPSFPPLSCPLCRAAIPSFWSLQL